MLVANYKTTAQNNSLKESSDTSKVNIFIESVMGYISIEKEKYSITTFPTMDYNNESGLSLGFLSSIVLNDGNQNSNSKYYRPTTIIPALSYSTKKHLLIDADLLMYTKNEWFIGSRVISYKVPAFYFGIGKQTEKTIKLKQNTYGVFGGLLKAIGDLYYMGLSYDIGHVKNYGIDNLEISNKIKGYNGGWHVGLGLESRVDTRDDVIYPTKGNLFNLSIRSYFGNHKFYVTKLNLRHYRKIVSDKNILAFQTTWTISNGNVPFYKMPKLGGKSQLRSINNSNKYINYHNYLAQIEYRRQFAGRFGTVIFTGLGNSAEKLDKSYFEDIIYLYGLGFRFRLLKKDRLNFRLDVGMGDGEPTMFMTIREAF
ncbi:MAG: hypothetical protein KAG96_03800 [Ichthyobacteriaceae bacterium]|nr:hypothetical protein [Ichthyobacteriaceae bacterium]